MSINFNYNYPEIAREAGFRLRQYKDGPLDWRLLGSFEIERLLRDQNLEDIDRILRHLSEAPLAMALLETNILDNGIAKYFIVSQFAIQYLLFCRNFLDETVQELRESHAEAQMELATLKKSLTEANNEILQLHKKMTQMEAIHEVIYPCHLCTKNFASNEALNIHIGRKHSGNNHRHPTSQEPKIDSASTQKDLTLINTIKLELEIKQLKERLNNTEREIKQRNQNLEDSKQNTPREVPIPVNVATEVRHVAIQSNLSEEKERNESGEDHGDGEQIGDRIEEKQQQITQLVKLQEKIYDIEEWRATQMANNEDCIAEINRKLTNIAQTLEHTATVTRSTPTPLPIDVVEVESQKKTLERRLSVEDLERVLSEKVAEIGKANSEKLEEIIQNMESNYREKLFELEREIKKEKEGKSPDVPLKYQSVQVNMGEEVKEKTKRFKRGLAEDNEIIQVVKSKDHGESDEGEGTYSIKIVDKPDSNEEQASNSNNTFVKDPETKAKTSQKPLASVDDLNDHTDISESLSEDEVGEKFDDKVKKPSAKQKTKSKKDDYKKEAPKVTKMSVPVSRKYTRKDAKILASKRLTHYGCDMKTKAISGSCFKQISQELQESRLKLKQKYPNFYATRNKIKKFVDKLCSTKLPEKAEKMLTSTPTLQPMKMPRGFQKLKDPNEAGIEELSDNSEDDDREPLEAVLVDSTREDFKRRLERLLASPMQRPATMKEADLNKHITTTIAQIHEGKGTKPLPMPRKRVMFNTT